MKPNATDPKLSYVSVLVGGMMSEQFRFPSTQVKDFGAGEEVVIGGSITQSTFKGAVSRRFVATEIVHAEDFENATA